MCTSRFRNIWIITMFLRLQPFQNTYSLITSKSRNACSYTQIIDVRGIYTVAQVKPPVNHTFHLAFPMVPPQLIKRFIRKHRLNTLSKQRMLSSSRSVSPPFMHIQHIRIVERGIPILQSQRYTSTLIILIVDSGVRLLTQEVGYSKPLPDMYRKWCALGYHQRRCACLDEIPTALAQICIVTFSIN